MALVRFVGYGTVWFMEYFLQLFVTAKFDQDPDQHGSARIGLAPWIRIRIEVNSWIWIRM
jgi:hypothetical protein